MKTMNVGGVTIGEALKNAKQDIKIYDPPNKYYIIGILKRFDDWLVLFNEKNESAICLINKKHNKIAEVYAIEPIINFDEIFAT